MLLTEALVDEIHAFRIRLMEQSSDRLKSVFPSAAVKAIGGGLARYAGDGSPSTQAYGIAHRNARVDLAELEEFYAPLTDNWELIVTPFDSPSILNEAARAGYVADHFETVLAQTVRAESHKAVPGVVTEEVVGDITEWVAVVDSAWKEREVLTADVEEVARVASARPGRRYLARVDGEPAAAASLESIDGKHLLCGDCTRPQFRGRGLQKALIRRRLADLPPGDLAEVVAIPGAQSHRNLQREGFIPLYTKLVLFRHD